jgi:cell division protein FtsL
MGQGVGVAWIAVAIPFGIAYAAVYGPEAALTLLLPLGALGIAYVVPISFSIIALLIIGGLILYVGGKVKIVRLGYQIEALEREKRELERANRSLRIEASSLSSPARIEEIAIKRLGMIHPPKENRVMVRRKQAPAQE